MTNIKSALEKANNSRLAGALLFIGSSIAIMWAVYFSVATIAIPYQTEFREGNALVLTRILLGGGNPFRFENQPLAMTNYGMGYNLVVLPFAALLGNTLLVHRAVAFAFIILSACVCAVTVYNKQKNIPSALACGVFVILGLAGEGGLGAFPSPTGTYFFLAAVLLPHVRSFDRTGLLASILLSLLAFYTKPYFILAFGIVAVYLFLFVSKRKAVIYGVSFLFLFLMSLFVTRVILPLYFINTVVGNISNTYKSFEHMLAQLRQLLVYFYPVLLPAVYMLAGGMKGKPFVASEKGVTGNWADVSNLDQPLVKHSLNYLFYSFVCSLLAFILILGPHMGNYMSYAYQLMVPLFFCWFFESVDLNHKFRLAVVLLVLFSMFNWETKAMKPEWLEQKNSKAWAELSDYVRSSHNVLNSPLITSQVVELGLTPVDSGQTMMYYNVKPYPDSKLIGPSYSDWRMDGYKYTRLMDRSVERQNFDLVVTTLEKGSFFHEKRLSEYYSVVATLVVDMPQSGQTWTVLVWKPLKK